MRALRSVLVFVAAFGLCSELFAQYDVTVTDGAGAPGDSIELEVILDFSTGDPIQGYQWGVCHDDTLLTLADGDVVNGEAIETVDFTFQAVSVFDDPGASGWTVGALLNVITGATIAPSDDNQMFTMTYSIVDGATGDADVEWCETLGTPVVTVRVIVSSDEIEPTQNNGSVAITGPSGAFQFAASDAMVDFDSVSGAPLDDAITTISIVEDAGAAGFPNDTAGFQMGIAHDGAVVELIEDSGVAVSDLADINGGDGPDFFGANYDPSGGTGFTLGVVYSLTGGSDIIFDVEKDMFELTYAGIPAALAGDDPVTTEITFVDTLGDPIIENAVVVSGANVPATGLAGLITFNPVAPLVDEFAFTASDVDVDFDSDTGVAGLVVTTISVQENDTNPGFPNATAGLQFGIAHNGDALAVVPMDADEMVVGVLADLNGGDGPDFFGANFDPAGGPGFTLGVVYGLTGGVTIEYELDEPVFELTYEAETAFLEGELDPVTTTIEFDDTLGDPVLPNVVVVSGTNRAAAGIDGTVTFTPGAAGLVLYINGDSNNDEVVNNLDAFFLISFQFEGGAAPTCNDAADANDDGMIDNLDTLLILNYVYLDGPDPAPPFPTCGTGPTPQDCESQDSCL